MQENLSHDEQMLSNNVSVRDGDDSIDLYGGYVDPFADESEEDEEGRMQVRVNDEGEVTLDGEGEIDGEANNVSESNVEPLGDIPESLTTATTQLAENEAGFNDMLTIASEKGITAEVVAKIQSEYADEGISAESYAELEKAGYTKSFVDSYIKGQEALILAYANEVKQYAGGAEQFDSLVAELETSNPEAAESLMNALANRDIPTVKAIINLVGQAKVKTYGKQPARSLANNATPKVAPKAPEGFKSQAEMIQAMSDPRYHTSDAYRREVESKLLISSY